MEKTFNKIIAGYEKFREKYTKGDNTIMRQLAHFGQKPEIMVIGCCDSRVDPALILQCDPGDLFVVRNVANIVPPFETDDKHHGTSAALEFGICYLKVKHLIILGHSQCGGIEALIKGSNLKHDDFITNWVSQINLPANIIGQNQHENDVAKEALLYSYQNCTTFPWLKERIEQKKLAVHVWFFDIKEGVIFTYSFAKKSFQLLVMCNK